jgi:hypothetical protein
MPISSQEQYDKAQALVSSGKAKDPTRLQQSMQRWERFAMPQKAALVEGIGPGTSFERLQNEASVQRTEEEEKARLQGQANKAGYSVDLSQPNAVQSLAVDPQRAEIISKVREATRDTSLPNASKLKVFNDPPDYEPPKPKLSLANPLAMLPTALQRHYFYEPSVEEFRSAMTDGNLARRLKKEFNLVDDVSKVSDEDLKDSTTYKAFQDASWKHALADAMKEGYPISRVSQTQKMGGFDQAQAKLLDPAMATANGALAGMTAGLSRPTETPEEVRSASRNPGASLGGEIVGSLTPTGLPSRIATGAAKLLGKAGLGSRGLQGVIKGLASAAGTGAVDANIRAAAKFAADALDAGDTAEEAAQRFYEMAKGIPETTLRGAGMGAAFGAGGEVLGGLAKAGARAIVKGQPRDILLHGQASGVKMGPLGEPKLPPDLEEMAGTAAARRATAESLIAEDVAPKLLSQRLQEQETAASRAGQETAAARAKLGSATVDTGPMAEELLQFANEMPGITPQAKAQRTALQRYARKIRQRRQLTAQELDDVISEADAQANQDSKKPDPVWNRASAILRKGRDEFQFNEPTKVDNYAIRDNEGNSQVVSDYAGLKARQSREQDIQEFENRQMGLPGKLEPAPVRIGPASPTDAVKFFEGHPNLAKIQDYFNTERAVASDVERSRFSRPKDTTRTVNAGQAQYATNKALSDAVDRGLGYQGTVYRGARMSPEEIQKLVASGKVKSDHLWSTSKDEGHAEAFAKKGSTGEPVVFAIDGSSGVDLDTVPGLNTFDEVGIPTGRQFQIVDSFRDKSGVLRVKMSDGTRGPAGDEVSAMAEGVSPQARLRAEDYEGFKGRILGTADPKNAIVTDKILGLARRAGLGSEESIKNIQRLRDAQNWKQYLGRAISGIGSGGGTYVRMNNLLRTVPSLNSLSGGLPKMEATPSAVDVVDRFLEQAVPSWRGVHLRGGQSARPAGTLASGGDAKPRDNLTQEEAEFAAAVIKNLRDMEK